MVLNKKDNCVHAVPLKNVALDSNDYAILEEDYQAIVSALKEWESPLGFYHTHLKDKPVTPTDMDIDGAWLHLDFENLVYKPDTTEFCWYSWRGVGR